MKERILIAILLPLFLARPAAWGQQVNKTMEMLPQTAVAQPGDIFLVTTGAVGTARSTRGINTSNLLESLAAQTNWSARVGSNITLDASAIATGTLSDARLNSDVTKQGNIFNGASQLIQLDGAGNLPALNGSALTALNAGNISSGTLSDLRLNSDVTKQGNIFNGVSQLVQLDSLTRMPAVDGSQLTHLTGGNVTASSLPLSAMANEAALSILGNLSGSPATPSAQTALPESFITSLPADLSTKASTNDPRSLQFSGPSITRVFNGAANGFMPVINALDYGLTTVGDQTANIQAAVNAATNAGQKVFIPAGTYQLNGTLVVSRIELMGETPASGNSIGTILNPGGGANTIIYIPTGSSGTYIHNLSIVDGGAHHLATGISTSTNANPVGTSNIKIENCTFFGLSRDIYLNYAWNIQLIDNFYNDATVCVWGTNNVNAVDIWGGHFFGQFGVRCDGFACFNWNVHSVLEACSNAVFFANDCEQMNVTGSYLESSTYGIVANGTYALNLDHNEMDSASQTNIVLVGCKFPYIGGNRFSASGVASWDVDSTTFGLHIAQNSFNGSPSWRNAAATSFIQDGTNVFNTGGYASFVNNKASLMSSNLPTSATWLFTNSDLVNWICYITGGTVTGVSQNTSPLAVSTTGITNASLTVILQPGESLGVTNGATAPRFSFKRF